MTKAMRLGYMRGIMAIMEINDTLKRKVALVARKHSLSCVVLFGSQATGKTHALSDTDVAFMADRDIQYDEKFRIEGDLTEALRIIDIETVNMDRLSPFFMKQIMDNGKLLYEDRFGRFIAFKVKAFKLFIEAKPLLELKNILINKFIARYA